ncbi:MAG: recombinase family protein [Chloroflexi bacterium]|nr:recombinase family protein [Chloroflexota bacterium]
MPAKRKYQLQSESTKPHMPGTMPVDRDIAVYYRQSSMAQVGNVSTDMQQIDLPKYVHSLGWDDNRIILIDDDEGVSGAKRIDERKGMSRLYDMINRGAIGAVAVQAEDRLFRDETQIQVNVFIQACVNNDVRVITPYFRYNFADKHEGSLHRLLFRMRAEQAADFLNSYVRGRLFAAKERMTMQGLWIGGNINLGFMVDDRKTLPSGMPNPNWRKFEPFEPCAAVVRELFEIFIQHGGNMRKTLAHIYEHGPHFPDFDDPDFQRLVPPGYVCTKPMRMLKRGGFYTPSRMAMVNMLTNVVYIGHWMFRNRIVQWNNHPPIVSEELFYRAFNYLSPFTITGAENPNYAPPFYRDRSKEDREGAKPIFKGLIGTYYEGEWRQATAVWSTGMKAYAYSTKRNDLATNQHTIWSRRCDYFDQVLTDMMFSKLRSTFDPEVWAAVLDGAAEDFEAERRSLTTQLNTVSQRMQALITNMSYIQSPTLSQAMEHEFHRFEAEQGRLRQKLDALERRVQRQEALMHLAKQAENVLANWYKMSLKDQRTVAHAFIVRIVVTPTGKHRVADVEIQWRDDSTDTFVLPYRSDKWTLWTPTEIESLTELLKRNATQVEIAQALPDRNWCAIRIKVREITGERSFCVAPKLIHDKETYAAFFERLERKEKSQRHTGSSRWLEAEMNKLDELLTAGATQLEIAAALPYRSWQAIRRRIILLRGQHFAVPQTGQLEDGETYEMYLTRDSSVAETMAFRGGGSLEQRRRTRRPSHQRRAWARADRAWRPG